jgi:hypothetical protein
MKIPDMYHNWRVILGIALIVLGSGNWLVGRMKTQEYSELLQTANTHNLDDVYSGFDELDSGAIAVLEPLTAEQRRVSYATARMDFYHATFLTGYVLVVAGLLLTVIGFLGLIRNDARRAAGRIGSETIRDLLSG